MNTLNHGQVQACRMAAPTLVFPEDQPEFMAGVMAAGSDQAGSAAFTLGKTLAEALRSYDESFAERSF